MRRFIPSQEDEQSQLSTLLCDTLESDARVIVGYVWMIHGPARVFKLDLGEYLQPRLNPHSLTNSVHNIPHLGSYWGSFGRRRGLVIQDVGT